VGPKRGKEMEKRQEREEIHVTAPDIIQTYIDALSYSSQSWI